MISNLWNKLFLQFLKKFGLNPYVSKPVLGKKLQQSSYSHEIGTKISKELIDYSSQNLQQLYLQLNSRPEGLSIDEAEQRLLKYGANSIDHEKPPKWWLHLWFCFKNPFNILLTVLALVAALTGDTEGTTIISIMVLISTLLKFWQESKSNKAAETLKSMVSHHIRVIRQRSEKDHLLSDPNEYSNSNAAEIPTQNIVPGDVIQLSAGDLVPADCRIISSKSLFVSQAAMTGESMPVEKIAEPQDSEHTNIFNLDNIIFMGTNIISGSAIAIVLTTGHKTYFGAITKRITQNQVASTSFQMGVNRVSWLLIRFMLVMAPIVFFINGFTKGDWPEAILFALSVAVGLTPEMLPMIVTSTLAKGALFLSRKKVIVKRLDAIQNFGAMDVLCTDKTGTLTEDKIVLSKYLDVMGNISNHVLLLAYINSYYQTGLKNLLDTAILEHADQNIKIEKLRFHKVDEIPFDFERRRMSVVVNTPSKKRQIITKGAIEEILSVCTKVVIDHQVLALTPSLIKEIEQRAQHYNHQGQRILALAYRDITEEQTHFSHVDENDLILCGFLAFLDPPKESTSQAIESLNKYGVTVKVLTGDNEFVTQKVCKDIGLTSEKVILGKQIEHMDDRTLSEAIEKYHIFAKLSPLHKERIVLQLKSNGHVVGFLGDGINDLPALKSADIGISVDSAVDIAKDSADLILLEKSLMVLEQGVLEGRRTFSNMLKYIKMTASSNFGNVFSVLVASAFLPFLPMLPIHLLLQNLLYDVSQIAIPFDNVDDELLQKPQDWQPSEIARFMIFFGPISSIFDILTFGLMWYVFSANTTENQTLFQSGWFIVGLLTQTLIVHMIRTSKVPFLQSRAAFPLIVMTIIIMGIGIFLPMGPWAEYFKLQALPLSYFIYLPCILIA
ncbi:magnesium-translocating P-type ATPase [Acinetobacter terrestris]|uniref:magnesium-translocating P-type ATPase n=1 Tax=Acinetobacter terrestris TaxID=2529843 RepID=UPI00352672FC